ncbi:hypothetical protein [Polyangium sp. y55x31]|uniref:hypothetical protein n=1 Tax=Polyangium sp. y55x31 TaxID=3042688 RepID=UPI002482DDFC|nr:hypothetical protein [Polyangium sp. y55x31]MDI1484071.1 hypothetical protein [Polyangium sp. y55x31]
MESENHGEPGFVHASRDAQIDWVFEILFGKGALDRDEAVGQVLDALVLLGLADEEDEAKKAKARVAVERAIDNGLRAGRFDRPKRGQIRAIRTDAKDYSSEDWTLCLMNALDREPTDRDAALRFAAYWAASNTGLSFARLQRGGSILTGLDAALESALRRGRFLDVGGGCVRKV